MKKTAATMILLAGMGGGCVSPSGTTTTTGTGREFNKAYHAKDVKGVSGPTGEPVAQAGAKVPVKRADSGVVPAGGVMPNSTDSMIQQASGFSRVGGGSSGSCSSCGGTGGGSAGCDTCGSGRVGILGRLGHRHDGGGGGGYAGGGAPAHPGGLNWGAVAYGAPGGYGMMGGMGGMYANQRTAIKFVAPQGMQISWFAQGSYAEPGLSTPSAYNFAQGGIYRLRVRGIPNRPGKVYYPTLDVYGATPKTVTFLSHNTVPVGFTDEDFDQVNAGNMVVKVIYLPDPAYQELSTVAGAEELVSTKLLPGEDPLAEAQRRGTILAVIRLGNIDLENPNSPPMSGAMPGGPAPGIPPMGMPMGAPMPGAPANVPQAMPGNAAVSIPPIPTTAKPTAPISTGAKGGFNR